MPANSLTVGSGAEITVAVAQPVSSDAQSPSQLPTILQRREGPFRDLDLLAIGTILVVVLAILAVRRIFRRR